MRRYLFICASIVCGLAVHAAADSVSKTRETNTPDYPLDPLSFYDYDSGAQSNSTPTAALKDTHDLKMEGSFLLRVYFSEAQLGPGSFIRVTSLLDGEVQELDAAEMAKWRNATAYFNGDEVMVELVAGPMTQDNRYVIDAVQTMYNRPQPVGSPGECGICGSDNRVESFEFWTGRYFGNGCTASVYHTGSCMVSAGHCVSGGSQVVQFNVPHSTSNCFLVNPPVADQFPVFTFNSVNGGPGNDWSVLTSGTNNVGQTPYERYGVLRTISPSPALVGASAEVTGYGADTTCILNQVQKTADGPINFVNGSLYEFSIDITGGNSGSALIRNDNESIIGIATHCPCPNIATRIDIAAFAAAINAACPPDGACCFPNGSCTFGPPENCTGTGTFQGGGTSCVPNLCPAPTGACCLSFGCLDTLSQSTCEANQGLYIGDGVPCIPDPCPQPNGACCLSFGCQVLDESVCLGNGGVFQGDQVPCTPDPCVEPCTMLGDINEDGSINGADIGGYTRAKLGEAALPGENQECADYGTGTISGDNAAFVADLLS